MRLAGYKKLGLALALGLTGVLWALPALGQMRRAAPPPPPAPPPQPAETEPRKGSPLRAELGVAVAARLLESDESSDRIRGVARLGSIGTTEAIDALVEALEASSAAGRDHRARLEAVRVLAPHAKRDPVRALLVRELTDAGADGKGAVSSLSALIRDTAALALARAGDKKALAELVNALLSGSGAGDAASRALRAAPPASIQPLLEARKGMSPALATLLGDLGDLRAIARLRVMLKEPDIEAKAAAAIALAKLGDDAPREVARTWAARPDPKLQRAAAEVLAYLGAPDAARLIATLIAADATRSEGIRLALATPSPELGRVLAAAIPKLPDADKARAAAALGRAGGPDAPPALAALMHDVGRADLATAAALALALLPGDAARAALEGAIAARGSGAAARLGVRAGIVRALALGDPPEGLPDRLEAMASAKDASDRAVAAFGLVALGAWSTKQAVERACPAVAPGGHPPRPGLGACDAPVLDASARAALVLGPDDLRAFRPVLDAAAPRFSVAGGVALLADPDARDISTVRLAAWAEAGGPLAPLAARALPSRDDEALRPLIKRLLEGSDPTVRAHVALGLARDPERDAVTVLANAYRFEDDAAVRRAIVRALSRRAEVQRRPVLLLARDLDPDGGVRALATSALEGRVLDLATWTPHSRALVAWVTVASDDPAARAHAALAVRADGLGIPVVADPDGVLLVPAMPIGTSSLELAPPSSPGDAGAR